MKRSTLCIDVPKGQRSVRIRFKDTGSSADVIVKRGCDGAISTTVAANTALDMRPIVVGDLVCVLCEDDDIVPDPDSSDSDAGGAPDARRTYGIVQRVLDDSVQVIWFYARSEFLRPLPRGFASRVAEYTLSTKVSDAILMESIERVATVPGMSDCVFCVGENVLKGDAHALVLYYRTLSNVYTHKAETGATFIEAVDRIITTKQGVIASVGTIRPSQMAGAISLFEDSGRARLPHDIGPELGKIGDTPLQCW